MSEGKRIPREQALEIAQHICGLLAQICERVAIAGSLRREKPEVGDIEIVCVPMPKFDLLSNEYRDAAEIKYSLFMADYKSHKSGDHFIQFDAGACNCDLFITTPEQWGIIFTIRTGSAEFSHRLVTARQYGGLLPSNLKVKDGRIWNGNEALDTPEEADVFKALNLPWIEPRDRI